MLTSETESLDLIAGNVSKLAKGASVCPTHSCIMGGLEFATCSQFTTNSTVVQSTF